MYEFIDPAAAMPDEQPAALTERRKIRKRHRKPSHPAPESMVDSHVDHRDTRNEPPIAGSKHQLRKSSFHLAIAEIRYAARRLGIDYREAAQLLGLEGLESAPPTKACPRRL